MKKKPIFSAFALVLICAIALSMCSCSYGLIEQFYKYDTIIIDGEVFRRVDEDEAKEVKDKNTVGSSLMLGDRVEYLIGDENGVPYDETKTENDAHWLGDEKEYVIDSYALVWGKDGRESYKGNE